MKVKIETIRFLKDFIGSNQLCVMVDGIRREEADYFVEKINETAALIKGMPKTHETDGQGDRAIAYLHYFRGGMDWYITEKDVRYDQIQAFGLADLGYYPELGYISIKELISHGVELDLHWTPKTIGEIKDEISTAA